MSLKGKGFDKASKALGPRFATRMKSSWTPHLYKMGLILRSVIIQGVVGQKFPMPTLSAITVHIKGSSKKLVDNGDLIASVSVKALAPTAVFVGVQRTAKRKGKNMFNVAEAMEFGHKVGVNLSTAKGRKAFRAMAAKLHKKDPGFDIGAKSGKKAGFIFTPARPFVRPGIEKAMPLLQAEYYKRGSQVLQQALKP